MYVNLDTEQPIHLVNTVLKLVQGLTRLLYNLPSYSVSHLHTKNKIVQSRACEQEIYSSKWTKKQDGGRYMLPTWHSLWTTEKEHAGRT